MKWKIWNNFLFYGYLKNVPSENETNIIGTGLVTLLNTREYNLDKHIIIEISDKNIKY